MTAKASDASRARRQAAAPRTTCRGLDSAFLYETSGDERVVCVCGLCARCPCLLTARGANQKWIMVWCTPGVPARV